MNTQVAVFVVVAALSVACKNNESASSALDAGATAKKSESGLANIIGECAVSELAARNATQASELESAAIASLTGVSLKLPKKGQDGNAEIAFRGSETLERSTIAEGLDLYDRQGRLAQLSGGVFKENFAPVVTTRMFFDTSSAGVKGFIELAWHDAAGKAVEARGTLACKWAE